VAAGCTTDEYGNLYSPMGFGECGHFVAQDKWYAGYFGGCNGVKVTSSGTFNLMPIEIPCNGIQGLQIAMPKTTRSFTAEQDSRPTALKNYYLELRVNGTPGEASLVKAPTVLVVVGDNITAKTRTSTHTFLLDMKPTTNGFDGLTTAGQSFSDPGGGLTFTVMSIDATHATIQVTYDNASGAAATCMDGSALAGAGPTNCSVTTGTGGAGGGAGGAGGGAGGTGGAGGGSARGGAGGSATGSAGRGGAGGSAGSTGAGGRGGATGAAGVTGAAGTTGSAGSSGGGTSGGGNTGAGGTSGGGTSGSAGSIGTTGAAGRGGATGTAGGPGGSAAGTSGPGAAGTTGGSPIVTGRGGASAGGAASQESGTVTGGCSCSTAPERGGTATLAWIALGAVAVVRRKRPAPGAARRHPRRDRP
jgi:hypothetical protein